jgi:hypothetical protein
MTYAVKKITFLHSGFTPILQRKLFREVKTLARLDSPNICRYYTSWCEIVWDHDDIINKNNNEHSYTNSISEQDTIIVDTTTTSTQHTTISIDPKHTELLDNIIFDEHSLQSLSSLSSQTSQDYDISISHSSVIQTHTETHIHHEKHHEKHIDTNTNTHTNNINELYDIRSPTTNSIHHSPLQIEVVSSSNSTVTTPRLNAIIPKQNVVVENEFTQPLPSSTIAQFTNSLQYKICLYVQTEYATGGTLLNFLNAPKRVICADMIMPIFYQIVSGLAHVHSKSIVHRGKLVTILIVSCIHCIFDIHFRYLYLYRFKTRQYFFNNKSKL